MNGHHWTRRWFLLIPCLAATLLLLLAVPAAADETPDATQAGTTDIRLGDMRLNRVLFLGNSITLHGPAPQIGWNGDWGMAASDMEHDYVHRLMTRIQQACGGGMPQVRIRNIADFERGYDTYDAATELAEDLAFRADLIVVAIGENTTLQSDDAQQKFSGAFTNLLKLLRGDQQRVIIVRSQFRADSVKDAIMEDACTAVGGVFVDISELGRDETNYARSERDFEHAGVAGHPGDRGMQRLADRVWQSLCSTAGLADHTTTPPESLKPVNEE